MNALERLKAHLARGGQGSIQNSGPPPWKRPTEPTKPGSVCFVGSSQEKIAENRRDFNERLCATDWRDYLEERAAIREHDGGMSRADAEAAAVADCLARTPVL